ncbi:MAG: hypothetical protein Q7R56_02850 [Nanoarchaeota archaeon]|nr:hypothetical protein [Nanoarchaeota archaeon]
MIGEEITLGIIIAAALADSINPCVFGVLIFLLAYMQAVFKNKIRMLICGIIYIATVYATYLLLGLGILTLAYTAGIAPLFYWVAAIIALLAGLIEIKDYFWYGKGFSLQLFPGAAERLKKLTNIFKTLETKHPILSLLLSAVLGVFVVLVELPCTGAPYLAILGMLSTGNYSQGLPLLLLYNFIFILPLFVIIGLMYTGRTSQRLERWRKEHRGAMRLAIGLFLFILGAYMLWKIL